MATATKNTRIKAKKATKEVEKEEEGHTEEAETEFETTPSKIKKPIEIDEPEPALVGGEEKIEEDPLIAASEDDELGADEIVLDTEELNPFGDRWEE
jgi:hypothetical protein